MRYLPAAITPALISHYLSQRKPFSAAQVVFEYSRLSHAFSSLYPHAKLMGLSGFLTTGGSIYFGSPQDFTQIARMYGKESVLSFTASWSLDEKISALLETPEEQPQLFLRNRLHLVGANRLRIATTISAPLDDQGFNTYRSLKELVETFK